MKVSASILALMAATAMAGCVAETGTAVKPQTVECDGAAPAEPVTEESFTPDEVEPSVEDPSHVHRFCPFCGMG
jgi:hypothetical protein